MKIKKFLSLAPKSGPKIVHLDIETFPIEAYVWGLFKVNVGLNQIKTDWSMMSFCAEWDHRAEQFYTDNRNKPNPRSELHQLRALHAILDVADMVVARNGKKFDLRKIKAKLVEHGFRPFSPIKVIDPMLLNRKEFAFTSQKLEYTTGLLVPELRKSTHSAYPGFELWRACLNHDPIAWQECEDYNRMDVISMKAEYHKVRGWYSEHPNVAVYFDPSKDEDERRCNVCGGNHLTMMDKAANTMVGTYELYECGDCGNFSRGRKLTTSAAERRHITVPA